MNKVLQNIYIFLKNKYRLGRALYWSGMARNLSELPIPKDDSKPRILMLLPEAGINLYIKLSFIIADQLQKQGCQVLFARCFNIFDRCIFMDSESLPLNATPAQKKQLCTYCFRSFHKTIIGHGFDYVDMRHFIQQEDKIEIDHLIAKQPEAPFDFNYEGINFTGVLEYNLFLYLKKSDILSLNDQELIYWQQSLKSLFVGYKTVKRIVEQQKITNVVMCDEYSLNAVIKDLSLKAGFAVTNFALPFHKDIDSTQIRIFQKDSLNENNEAVQRWTQFKPLSINAQQAKEAVDDLIIRMSKKGTYSYSSTKSTVEDILSLMGLDKNKKTIIAYPSSPDEVDALINANRKRNLHLPVCEDAFKNQFDWLDELIDFVEKSAKFQLVVRIHPRMAPNHREKWGCSDNEIFIEKYKKLYRHVKIVWPQDPISSYDLAEIADVVTVAWSSMGAFMARLGIPVISGLKLSLPIPNDDFHVFAKTKEEYFNRLQLLTNIEPCFQNLIYAVRYYNMITLSYCVDMNDVIDDELNYNYKESANGSMLRDAIIQSENVAQINLSSLKKYQSAKNSNEESLTIHNQIYRLIHFFMTNEDDTNAASFKIIFGSSSLQSSIHAHMLWVNNGQIKYFYQGKIYSKHSLLVERLAKIATTEEATKYNKKVTSNKFNIDLVTD